MKYIDKKIKIIKMIYIYNVTSKDTKSEVVK
jgi:hypothetical protein